MSTSPFVELFLPINIRSCRTKNSNSLPWIFAIGCEDDPCWFDELFSFLIEETEAEGDELEGVGEARPPTAAAEAWWLASFKAKRAQASLSWGLPAMLDHYCQRKQNKYEAKNSQHRTIWREHMRFSFAYFFGNVVFSTAEIFPSQAFGKVKKIKVGL